MIQPCLLLESPILMFKKTIKSSSLADNFINISYILATPHHKYTEEFLSEFYAKYFLILNSTDVVIVLI